MIQKHPESKLGTKSNGNRKNYQTVRDTLVNELGTEHRWATQKVCILIHSDRTGLRYEDAQDVWARNGRAKLFADFYDPKNPDQNPLDLYETIEKSMA